MADKDADEPSLELPSLGLRRKRRKRGERRPDTSEPPTEPRASTAPPEAATPPAATPPTPAPPAAAPPASPPTGAPAAPPGGDAAVDPAVDEAPTRPLQPVHREGAPAPAHPAARPTPVEPPAAPSSGERKPARRSREFSLPRIGGFPAAIITGLLVGVITVGLTWAGFRLCEVVRGTSSCGDPGFLLLLAILVAMVLLGSRLLRAWGLPDPGSTSFLAVGLLAVMVLLFLVQTIFSWWMVFVIPAVAATTFALAHWVTNFVGDAE